MSTAIGAVAPDFRLPTTDGGEIALADLAGAPSVVAFWCNHCPYVRAWEERFNEIAREYADRGVVTVAICANDATSHPGDSFENMVVRAAEAEYTFAYAHDVSQQVAARLRRGAHARRLRDRSRRARDLPRRDRRLGGTGGRRDRLPAGRPRCRPRRPRAGRGRDAARGLHHQVVSLSRP